MILAALPARRGSRLPWTCVCYCLTRSTSQGVPTTARPTQSSSFNFGSTFFFLLSNYLLLQRRPFIAVTAHRIQSVGLEMSNRAAADFYVKAVPALPDSQSLLVYAGYLPARPGYPDPADDAHLYFLLEKARHLGGGDKPGKRRLLLWLNGGPGCSSFDGLMMEIGSWRPSMTSKNKLEWTVAGGAWNEYTDILFLDQPVGTGFSYASTDGYAHNLTQAAKDISYFLKRFVEVFPEYSKDADVDFFIGGER